MESLGTVAGRRSIEVIRDMVPGVDERRLAKALSYAFMLYGDRTMDLLPQITFYDHAVRTAQLLAEFCPDEDAIIAAILQHALKVPEASIAEIGKEFGRPVRDIVSRIHLLSHLYTTDWRKSVDDMKIMLVSVADDIRVLLTALSVACVLMEQLEHVKSEYRMRLCRQSLQLFAPVAARLGIYALKYRLEKSAFPECYPTDAQHIGLQIKRLHTEHGQFLERSAERLKTFLHEQGIEAQVMARQKQSYSIFQKMHSKSVTALEKITDLFAIRVVVKTVPDCYQTLGLIHQLATPISHRFKDYISFPKPNGYQSLHTCLIGLPEAPDDVMIEVQIRTADMHREAEYGIAAHWMYKEHGRNRVMNSVKQMELSDVLLKQQSVSGDAQAGEGMTLVDHIYVLTPRGDIIELPDGGTPLDFAFTLHTDLGLKYKAARVNGGIVPISYKLENGDVIEILTNKHPRPTLQWLEELVTPSGRSKLKAYFFSHNRSQFLTKGKDAVNAELKIRGQLPLDTELSAVAHYEGKTITQKEREDLLVKVGMGSVRTSSILR
ncbi:MAG: bifunctional (p)ppGpp synthetase/guanosine-3',5'-bis(diphosphate) 3'-pyrophosphohydrolase, partial [Candidatus Peribacteraceae bacterium]|nr:bifunctional (p)ppGpp synthetase/guanosine-3',5'-bis(diphosphate) 3'-pyrophosphohydrolase [Candidatus Peribacteraceae bacterium]